MGCKCLKSKQEDEINSENVQKICKIYIIYI